MTSAVKASAVAPLSRVRPVGVQFPSSEMMLIGALLYANPADRLTVVSTVTDDDLESPSLRKLLGLVRDRARGICEVDATLIADDALRSGRLVGEQGALLSKALSDATTCAASGEAVISYAAAVVGEAYRRRYESLGTALAELSSSLPEHELLGYLVGAGSECRAHSKRLTSLREASGAAA